MDFQVCRPKKKKKKKKKTGYCATLTTEMNILQLKEHLTLDQNIYCQVFGTTQAIKQYLFLILKTPSEIP